MGHRHSKNTSSSTGDQTSKAALSKQQDKKSIPEKEGKTVSWGAGSTGKKPIEHMSSSSSMPMNSRPRKSDLKDATKLLTQLGVDNPVERVIDEPDIAPVELEMPVGKDERLSRTKSALQNVKKAFSGLYLAPRSKSMPLPVPRRADIFLDENTMTKLKHLQEDMKHTMHSDDSLDHPEEGGRCTYHHSINEVKLMKFMRSHCEYFTFGNQRLEGVPGEVRSMNGSLPGNIFVSCIKGLKSYGDTTANQDNYSYCKIKDIELFCVHDGHGTCGHIVSYRTVRTLPYYIIKSRNFPSNIENAIMDGYEACQRDLIAHSVDGGFDLQISGCACTLALKRGNTLWLSNAGDSRIIVGQLDSSAVVMETVDHKPTTPCERQRLEQRGSEVHTFRFDNGHVEISRVFVKGKDYPGLCMSRSLGDQSVKECGVTAVPDIISMNIEPGKHFVVLASDGVWEFIPSKLVASSLSKRIVPEGGSKCIDRILTESKKRWKQNEGSYCDDITAMLVIL